jgi:hypothetical protein
MSTISYRFIEHFYSQFEYKTYLRQNLRNRGSAVTFSLVYFICVERRYFLTFSTLIEIYCLIEVAFFVFYFTLTICIQCCSECKRLRKVFFFSSLYTICDLHLLSKLTYVAVLWIHLLANASHVVSREDKKRTNTTTYTHTTAVKVEGTGEKGGKWSGQVHYDKLSDLGSVRRSKRKWAACYYPDTTVGVGSNFSIPTSRLPRQGICRMGPRVQEETRHQAEMCDNIY